MIETRPQDSVAEGGDPGDSEEYHINFAAVTARRYNLSATSPQGRLRQRDD